MVNQRDSCSTKTIRNVSIISDESQSDTTIREQTRNSCNELFCSFYCCPLSEYNAELNCSDTRFSGQPVQLQRRRRQQQLQNQQVSLAGQHQRKPQLDTCRCRSCRQLSLNRRRRRRLVVVLIALLVVEVFLRKAVTDQTAVAAAEIVATDASAAALVRIVLARTVRIVPEILYRCEQQQQQIRSAAAYAAVIAAALSDHPQGPQQRHASFCSSSSVSGHGKCRISTNNNNKQHRPRHRLLNKDTNIDSDIDDDSYTNRYSVAAASTCVAPATRRNSGFSFCSVKTTSESAVKIGAFAGEPVAALPAACK